MIIFSISLNDNLNPTNNFSITFKDGKIIDCKAAKGEETLKNLIATDEGSHYLGEVALVPYSSPINESGILFYNTLFDENASCHLAFGDTYLETLKDYGNMKEEELKKLNLNESVIHVDFMIGAKDLDIIGYDFNNKPHQIFKNGNWAI